MDDRATLNNRERSATKEEPRAFPVCRGTVLVDQAIFTSVRGPMAEGYRIVAATPGVTPAERAEITRRCPSHGSLCNDRPSAVALSAYPLDSGRYCVAVSRPAGTEHTARGGQRVWTHIAVLDDAAYRAFACNPVAVHATLCRADGPNATTAPSATLDPLRLSSVPPTVSACPARIDSDWILSLSRAVLCDERLIVTGAEEDAAALDALVISLPLTVRQTLSVSCGLRYAATRRLQLSFVEQNRGHLQRVTRGQPVRLLDIASAPDTEREPYGDWLRLLGRWFDEGRMGEIAALAAAFTGNVSPAGLNCVARIWACIDAAGVSDDETAGTPMPSAAL